MALQVTISAHSDTDDRRGLRSFLVYTTLIALAASTAPYIAGYFLCGKDGYLWAGTSPSDYAVYLAWMYTAAHGGFREQHLFAGGHPGFLLNPVYLLLGLLARVTHMPLFAAYQVGRLAFGCALLYVLWRFIRMTVSDRLTRRLAFLFICFSSGFGWIAAPLFNYPTVDQEQPEAITFLTLYAYPHFCASLALQVAILGLLFKAEMSRRTSYAAWAGICGGLLAIEHTYDVITVSAIWLVYLIVRAVAAIASHEPFDARGTLLRTGLALFTSSYGVAYILIAFKFDPVFATRDVTTPSYDVPALLIGYGGVLLLASLGVVAAFAKRSLPLDDGGAGRVLTRKAAIMLTVWAVVNSAIYYLPVSFQRKLIQGDHVALSILGAVGAAYLLRRWSPRAKWIRVSLAEIALAGFLSLGNLAYVQRDLSAIANGHQMNTLRPSITPGEADALDWIGRNTAPMAVIQPIPWMAFTPDGVEPIDFTLGLFVPGFTGRPVYAGHWSETPNFSDRMEDAFSIVSPETPEAERKALEQKCHINYFIFSQKDDRNAAPLHAALASEVESGDLKLVYSNTQADVYEVAH